MFPGRGPSCGSKSVQQDGLDQAVTKIVETQLLDIEFLKSVLGKLKSAEPSHDSNAKKLARGRSKLEGERTRLLRLTLKGTFTEEEFRRESKGIENEIRSLDGLAPAPVPDGIDPAKIIVRISRAFARFVRQPLEERRDLLRVAFKEIVAHDGYVSAVTLNGSFLMGVNPYPQSTSQCLFRCRERASAAQQWKTRHSCAWREAHRRSPTGRFRACPYRRA